MRIQTKLFLCVSFIVVSLVSVILLISFSFLRVLNCKDDVGLALSTYTKWSVLNNSTKVLLMADKDLNDAFENWRASLRDFTEQHEILVNSERIRSMGYEMEGILRQSQGLWGFYRTIVDQVIDILDTDEGKEIFRILESNKLSIITAVEKTNVLRVEPAIMQDIKKIRDNLNFRRTTSEGAAEATQASAENDFNWLWNNSFIPLLESEIKSQIQHIFISSIVVSLFIIMVTIFITLMVVRSITKPLNQFLKCFIEGAKGNFSMRYPIKRRPCNAIITCLDSKCIARDALEVYCFVEIGSYAEVFNKKVTCPHIIAGEVENCSACLVYKTTFHEEMTAVGTWFNVLMGKVERSVKIIQDAQLLWQKSMELGPQMQRSLYQQKVPAAEPWDVASYFKSTSGVSGNFYDFYFIENHLKGVGLFNVTGHGISAALMTVISKSLIFRLFNRMQTAALGKVIKNAGEALNQEIGEAEHCLTGVLLRIHDEYVEYVNTGIPNILLKTSAENSVKEIAVKPIMIGGTVSSDEAIKEHQALEIKPGKNDFLVLYADGLTQVRNLKGEFYGIDRLKLSMLRAPLEGSAQNIMKFLTEEIFTFIGQRELSNDIALIVIRKN
jgi:serine phosphatase RsbU (regulator of sigma subunit)